jgi:hypothetical protein
MKTVIMKNNGLIYVDGYSYVTMINKDINIVYVRPHEVVKFLFSGYNFLGNHNV